MFQRLSGQLLFITLLSLTSSATLASTSNQWWNAFSAKTKVQDYRIGITSEQKWRDEGSALYLTNLKLNVSRALSAKLSAGLELRYENTERLSGANSEEMRFTPYLTHTLSINEHWSFASRLKAENRWRHGDHALRARLRGKLSRDFDTFKLFGSYEYFYQLTDHSHFDKSRSTLGYSTSLSDRWGLDVYYLYQNNSNNTAEHVLGSTFSYTF